MPVIEAPADELIDVMLAVNDHNGNHTGRATCIEIPDWIYLEGPIFEPHAAPICRVEPVRGLPWLNWLRLGRRRFPIASYRKYVGNIVWDCAWMPRHVAANLLNHARKMRNMWTCNDAEHTLFEKWSAGEALTWQDLAPDGYDVDAAPAGGERQGVS